MPDVASNGVIEEKLVEMSSGATAAAVSRRALMVGLAVTLVAGRPARARQEGTPGPRATPAAWRFTDDRGVTISLAERPERIVAQVASAAALWDYGVRPVAVFGPQRNADGTPAQDVGQVDLESVESLGEEWGEFDLEKLLTLDADLIVGPFHPEGDIWYLPPEMQPAIEDRTPIAGIQFTGGVSAAHIVERYAELAELLGADMAAPAVTDAIADHDTAVAELREAIAGNPGLTVMTVSGTPDLLYVANPSYAADLVFLKALGLDIVQHGQPGMWEELSWEQANTYSADLILVDARAGAMAPDEYAQIETWAALPAVQAGQLGPWRTELPYSHASYAGYFRELAEVIRNARPDIA